MEGDSEEEQEAAATAAAAAAAGKKAGLVVESGCSRCSKKVESMHYVDFRTAVDR